MASVWLEHLVKTYAAPHGGEVRAVNDVTMTVESGELLVLVGPSGSGKTTLLRLIAGLETPVAGRIRIDGEDLTNRPPQARDVAMVFQEHSLYPHLSIRQNLGFGLFLRRFKRADIENRVREAAELLGLTALLGRLPQHLSGGERQRVALGRAIVLRPKVFLLDEPLSNLDGPLRAQMRRELVHLHRCLGATMIYVTHDQVEAMTLAERLAVIKGGVLQQLGRPPEVYDQPANTFVAGFIGTPPMNLFPGSLVGQDQTPWFRGSANGPASPLKFQLPPADQKRLAAHLDQPVILGLRPEHLRVLWDEKARPDELLVQATVTGLEPLGWETHLLGEAGGGTFVARVASSCPAKTGESIRVAFALGQAHWFDAQTGRCLT